MTSLFTDQMDLPVALDAFDLNKFAILLDVDGTILDIAPTPHEVHVPDTLRRTLSTVADRAGGALALVSGRPIADLDFIFAPLILPAVGGHGAEIRPTADGKTHEMRGLSLDRALKADLTALAERHPGVGVEDKGYSLALHYRLVLEQKGLEVVDAVFRICKNYPPESYELLTGKAVIEVKSVGFNKGTAVRELMGYPPFAGRAPIFIGDDTTDEAAFAVVPEFDGLAISVGRKVPGIDGRFQSPSDVRLWLDRLSRDERAVVPSMAAHS
jgi:trehalose 6-phosphate phosphatase